MKHIISLLAVLSLSVIASAQTIAPFKDGERIVTFGDSITEGGHYHSYLWLYYATHFPYMDIKVTQSGIGGNTVEHMYKRFDTDVVDKKPTYLTVMFGMNDSGYFEYYDEGWEDYAKSRLEECKKNYSILEQKLKGMYGTNIVMMGSTPYDEGAHFEKPENVGKGMSFDREPIPHKNDVIKQIGQMQKESARTNGWDWLDINEPIVEAAARLQAKDPAFTFSKGDRIHPDNAGDMLIVYNFLKAQGLAGKPVADILVDARSKTAVTQENCSITSIEANSREISFDYLAESLPYPLDTISHDEKGHAQSFVKEMVPFMEDFNKEQLAVSGLRGSYKLDIDGVELGTYTGEQLAEGINMAELSWAPQYQQALEVMHLNEMRHEIEVTFRYYAWCQYDVLMGKGLLNANDQRAQKVIEEEKTKNFFLVWHYYDYNRLMHKGVREARLKEIDWLAEQMYSLNKPVTHKIRLRKISK